MESMSRSVVHSFYVSHSAGSYDISSFCLGASVILSLLLVRAATYATNRLVKVIGL